MPVPQTAAHPPAVTANPADLEIVARVPVRPTPAGAFRAAARRDPDPIAALLLNVLREPTTPLLDETAVCRWAGTGDLPAALGLLAAAQDEGLIEGVAEAQRAPEGDLDLLVPRMLEDLSDQGEVLLADTDGLPLWSHGFEPSLATRLAAMSGDIGSLNERHAAVLAEAVGGGAGAWALVDGVGASRVGCWPLHIGGHRFVLVVRGLPRMHHPSFTQLIWLLIRRYG